MNTKEKNRQKKYISTTLLRGKNFLITASALFILTMIVIGSSSLFSAMMTGTITGKVFQDYNGNGTFDTAGSAALPAIDSAVGNITVTAYDSAGAVQGTTTTSATLDGGGNNYTLTATGTGPYRVEFTVPAPYQPSARSTDSVTGGTATNSGSTVQFVNNNNTANVNLAINIPEDYCQNNPETASCNYSTGNQTVAPSSTITALLTFPYTAGSTDATTTATVANFDNPDYKATTNSYLNVQASQIGTTFGLAYARSTRLIYAAAFFKRHSGFGTGVDNTINTADDPAAVYAINRTGNANKGAVASKFTVPGITLNQHDTTNYQTDNNNAGWDAVGKTSLGGMAISTDDAALYVMNLENRTLYRRNLAAGTFTSQAVPTTGLTTANGTCTAADVRPFAVTYYRGDVYVGMVCSGESSATVDTFTDVAGGTAGVYDSGEYYLDSNNNGVYNAGEPYYDANGSGTYNAGDTFVDNDGNGIYNLGDARKLTAYVFKVDATTLAFGATPIFTAPLNYKRGLNQQALGAVGIWRPWSATYRNVNTTTNRTVYSQPMLTGITFDRGNLVLGLRDRGGDEVGHLTQSNPGDAAATYQPRTAGDTLRACGNPTSGWTLEANGRCGGTGTAPQNTDQGPKNGANQGGEFYYGDSYDLAYAFNQPAGQTDIAGKGGNHDELSVGGVAQMPGAPDVMATIFDPIPNVPNETHDGGVRWLNNTTGNFAKAYRIYDGDTATVGTLGKSNGIGDLELLCDSAPIELGNRIWNDANGNGVQDPGENAIAGVTVRLYNASNVAIATAVTDASGEYYFISGTAADPTPTDNIGIVNGQITPNTAYQIRLDLAANYSAGGPLNGLVLTRANSTAQAGIDDSNDSDAANVVNPTNSPAGTFPVISVTTGAAGSNDHTLDIGFSTPVSIGSTVFNDANNNGLFDTGETGIGGVLVQLLYDSNNDGVINGTELTTPIASINTSSVAGSVGNYYFNGLTPGIYQVRIPTPPATATLSSAPAVTDTADNQEDNDDNGTQTGGAGGSTISPIINLLPDTEPINAVETGQGGTQDDADDNNGDMTIDFGFLAPAALGNRVWIDTNRNGIQDPTETAGVDGVTVTLYDNAGNPIATTITAGGGLYSFTGLFPGTYSVGFARPFGYGFSPQDAAGSTEANDSDVNILTGRTATVTLVAGQTNNDLDAGVFLSVAVGNRVWNDVNNNGILDTGETGIFGVTVNLYLDADNNGTPDGGSIRTVTTDVNGLYLFDGLAPDTYIVGVVTPANFISSSVNAGDPDADPDDNDDNGVVVSGTETRSNPVTLSLAGEPTGEAPNDTTTTADNSGNLTVDFGFTRSYSIGNRVWFDTNNNGQINAAEVGINGVSVSLFASTDLTTALQTTTTAADTGVNGYYRFDNVAPGSYVVRINPSNFASGGALAGYQNTTGNTAANQDSTATLGGEDGINPTGAANTVLTNGILSNVKTIAANSTSEPTAETDVQASGQGNADNQANMTIDFGFYRMSLSGTVWSDTGAGANRDNGILDAGEALLPNVVVILYDSTGTPVLVGDDGILGTADDGTSGMLTDASGNYNFQGLPPGTYRVGVNTARTGTSSTPTAANTDNNIDNDDDGGVNASFPQRVVSGLITLTPGGEPTVTQATGTTLNTTVDFGFIVAPTLVTLENFDVLSDSDSTTVKWETASEDANLGFNVYREANGKRELLNSSPIIGTSLRSRINLEAKSAGYSWTDIEPVENAVYYLEDIDMKGRRTVHGPVTPVMQDSGLERQSNPKLLSDLRKLTKSAKQTDSVETGKTAAKAAAKSSATNAGNKQRQFEIAAREGVKIAASRDGWYRITLAELQTAGFNLNSDPNNWQFFADGEEIPFRFGADNSVEFYGHGLDLLETGKQTYYLTNGRSAGQRLPEIPATEVDKRDDAASFRNTAAIKDRSIYLVGVLNGDEGNWFGALVYQGETASYDLAVSNRYNEGQARLKVKLQGLSDLGHAVNLRFNNLDLGLLNFDGYNNQSFEFDVPMANVLDGNNRITLSGVGNEDDLVSVDEMSLTYERKFTARDNKLTFRVPAGNTVKVGGFTDENISVVEVANNRAARRLTVQSEQTQNGFAFSLNAANYDREFIAFVDSQALAADSIVRNTPSTWNSTRNAGQFVIIAPERFREAADNLARVRGQEGLQTQVVPVEDIYDEFSYGATSVASLKEFLRTASQTWQVAPKYVLLLGDASYDMRNYLAQPDRNLVPTKLVDTETFETSSDGWIADFNNDGIEDLAVGRLPAGTETEAARMVGKVTRQRDVINEQKTNLFVADSGFDADADALRSMLRSNVASSVIRRSELDVAQMRGQIIDQTNSGQSVITYVGHGSSIAWSSSGFFRTTDTIRLKNDRLSFYLLMTCLNGYAIDPGSDSLSESLMKAENGAYAVWVSSGATPVYGQTDISRAATDLIFNRPNQPLRIGDIARVAKSATQDVEVRQTWQLMGDPTMFVK